MVKRSPNEDMPATAISFKKDTLEGDEDKERMFAELQELMRKLLEK